MTTTSFVAPHATPDDGRWHLVVAAGPELADASAAQLQRLCMEIAEALGGHTAHPLLQIIETDAWRLEPE